MKAETIKAIFTNLLFVIGVILLIFGFIHGTQTAVRLVTFDKYPLQSYEETRCDMDYLSSKAAIMPGQPDGFVREPEEDVAARRNSCLNSVEHERRVKQTEDVVAAITTLVAGGVLVLSFRKFIFK